MTTGISPKPKTACRPISGGTTRNVSINPWSTTPPSRFTPAGSPWFRRLRETFGTPTPKTKTSENHFREHDQGEQESFYDVFSPKNHPQIITLSESIFCLDNGEHFISNYNSGKISFRRIPNFSRASRRAKIRSIIKM